VEKDLSTAHLPTNFGGTISPSLYACHNTSSNHLRAGKIVP